MIEAWGNARYSEVNYGEAYVPSEITPKAISIDGISMTLCHFFCLDYYTVPCVFSHGTI